MHTVSAQQPPLQVSSITSGIELDESEGIELASVAERGYIIVADNSGSRVLNGWREHCRAHRLPFIIIRPGRWFAELDIDTASCPMTERTARRIFETLQAASVPTEPSIPGAVYSRGPQGANSSRIPPDRAESVAVAVLQVISDDQDASNGKRSG